MISVKKFKKQLSPIFNSQPALRLRSFLNIKAPFVIEPANKIAPISTLFYWKEDARWETMFNLINIGTSIMPDEPIHDRAMLYVYDSEGKKIREQEYRLAPHELERIYFKDFGLKGCGSFGIFHDIGSYGELIAQGSHVSERGYVGYRRDGSLWNFVHGDFVVVYYDQEKSNTVKSMLLTQSVGHSVYNPQIEFDDCDQFSIILINASHQRQKIIIQLKLSNGKMEKRDYLLGPFCTNEVLIENRGRLIKNISVQSKMSLCRPNIIKYYDSYFDVFHT